MTSTLAASPRRFVTLDADTVCDGTLIVAPSEDVLRILRVSASLLSRSGLAETEVVGRRLDEVLVEPRGDQMAWPARHTFENPPRTLALRGKGEDLVFAVNWHSLHGEPDGAQLLALRDVTEQRRLEHVAAARELAESAGYFSAGIRHEIGNPLNSLKAAVTLLADPVVSVPSERRYDYLRRALGEIARIETLLEQLRTFNTNERAELATVDLHAFVTRFVRLTCEGCAERGVTLQCEPGNGELLVSTDHRLLHQVLTILLANALEALEAAPRRVVSLRCAAGAHATTLSVMDCGPGMTREQLHVVQRPFVTTKARGTGLGLPLAHHYAALGGFSLSVSSEVGVGTTCTLHFGSPKMNTS